MARAAWATVFIYNVLPWLGSGLGGNAPANAIWMNELFEHNPWSFRNSDSKSRDPSVCTLHPPQPCTIPWEGDKGGGAGAHQKQTDFVL